MARYMRRTAGQSAVSLSKIAEIALETLSGIRVVQAFGMEKHEQARFRKASRILIKLELGIARLRAFSSPLMEVMAAVGLAAAIWWVGALILSNQLEPGKFFSFIAAVMLLYQPVKMLGRVGQTAIVGAVSAERIFEILDARSSVPDAGTARLDGLREAIRYERVSFAYGDRKVLDGLDLVLRKGEMVALVGPSGGGKTTVANLLPRFWDPAAGRIAVDGRDVRDFTLASLRAQIAVVSQETVLFNDTVRANIAYGRDDVSAGELERAARIAQAHDFIAALPAGSASASPSRGRS
jgi:subfamily B ATP-binding cassette protein MsbA